MNGSIKSSLLTICCTRFISKATFFSGRLWSFGLTQWRHCTTDAKHNTCHQRIAECSTPFFHLKGLSFKHTKQDMCGLDHSHVPPPTVCYQAKKEHAICVCLHTTLGFDYFPKKISYVLLQISTASIQISTYCGQVSGEFFIQEYNPEKRLQVERSVKMKQPNSLVQPLRWNTSTETSFWWDSRLTIWTNPMFYWSYW